MSLLTSVWSRHFWPVVGVPLPLVSYGGSALIVLMAGFGIIMSIHTHPENAV
ncbi:FtsW/RodA/SpoVE family cell cycle protein [Serratia ureilytica]